MADTASAPLTSMLQSITALQTLLTTSSSTATYSTLPNLISSLTTSDDGLVSTLKSLQQHQANYARILVLRAEAARLDDELKTIIRRADGLRTEIGEISHSILDDDSDDAEEDITEVEYETLLRLAARIGKHNILAAKAAEEDTPEPRLSVSRPQQSAAQGNTVAVNGIVPNAEGAEAATALVADEADDIAIRKRELNTHLAHQRAAFGISFPDNNILRLGALGDLQLIREGERGEEAVDAAVERMVRESEPVEEAESVVAQRERVRRQMEEADRVERERKERAREDKRRRDEGDKARPAGNDGIEEAKKEVKIKAKTKNYTLDIGGDSSEEEDED